ncbi:unnamed protein product [Amoebophrya sp. A120]|nr:unnamed protein product [Amoebophrya sp. A120]|eukprot:GSA120T00005554001.1
MGKKDSNNQMEAWRKKAKDKVRAFNKNLRKDAFDKKTKNMTFDDAQEQLEDLQGMKESGAISHKNQGRLATYEKYLANNAPELLKRQKEKKEKTEEEKRERALEKRRKTAKFSVFYHPTDNPFGIPPPGEKQQYRHPDGSVQAVAPFANDDSDSEDNAKKRRKAETLQLPGFSAGMLAKIRKDAQDQYKQEKVEQGTPAEVDVDHHISYTPPMPETPYPFYNAPTMKKEPIVNDSQLIRDTIQAISNVREALLQNVIASTYAGYGGKMNWGKDGAKGSFDKGKNFFKGDDKGKKGGKSSKGSSGGKSKGRSKDEAVLFVWNDKPPERDLEKGVLRPGEKPPAEGADGTTSASEPKASAASAAAGRSMLLQRLARKGKTTDTAYLQAQTQVSAAATTTKEESDVAQEMSKFLREIDK